MELSKRKKELSDIFIALSKIEKEEEKNLLSSSSFPRIYGHYEKFIETLFNSLIESIFNEETLKLKELKENIGYYLLFISFKEIGENSYLKNYSNLNNDSLINNLKKEKIKSYISNLNVGKNYFNLFSIFNFKDDELKEKLALLQVKLSLLTKKYESRNHIVHGHLLNDDIITFNEFERIKNITEESLTLLNEIFEIYLSKKLYKTF